MWQARFYQSLPRIVADYPDVRWMFLTLTVRNCAIGELGETLNRMNAGFQRLKDRKEFSPVQGWIRTTEVTRGSDGSALKDVLKLDQETDADMVIGDDISEGDDDGSRIAFEWKTEVRKYRRSPTKDKTESD